MINMKAQIRILVICFSLIPLVASGQPINSLQQGVTTTLFNAHAASTGNSTAYGLLPQTAGCSWQSSFASSPASISLLIQVSNDNVNWSTYDTSTSVSGEARQITTSASQIRARIDSVSMGSGITATINCKQLTASSLLTNNNTFSGTNTFPAIGITGNATGYGSFAGTPAMLGVIQPDGTSWLLGLRNTTAGANYDAVSYIDNSGIFSVFGGLNIEGGFELYPSDLGTTYAGGLGFYNDLIPAVSTTHALGKSTSSWSNLFTKAVTITGLTTPNKKPVCFDSSGALVAGTNTAGTLACP